MRRRPFVLAGVLLLLGLSGIALALRLGRGPRARNEVRASLSASSTLGPGDTAGFLRAYAPRPFRFPGEHGPHPGFRNEWWYFTGNLRTRDGRRFGYELTFFRSALAARAPLRSSEWAARDVYMAHFAITDEGAGVFTAHDRFERGGAMELAGATAPDSGWRVWVGDWAAASLPVVGLVPRTGSSRSGARPASDRGEERGAAGFWPLRLVARDSGTALGLTLGEGKPPVAQGEQGLSRKGPEPGNASYYYSLTRMPTAGWLESGGRRYSVTGESWMDREWSTSALGRDEAGWDWFALQLSDGRELMLYRIRRRDGRISPFSGGTVVERDGRARPLAASDARVDVLGWWRSPLDGVRYPGHWRVAVPSAGTDLDVKPLLADQELNVAVRYWEGAVDVSGTARGRPVGGSGYVELTGYGESAGGRSRAPATR